MEDSVAKWMFHFWNLLQEIERAINEEICNEKKGTNELLKRCTTISNLSLSLFSFSRSWFYLIYLNGEILFGKVDTIPVFDVYLTFTLLQWKCQKYSSQKQGKELHNKEFHKKGHHNFLSRIFSFFSLQMNISKHFVNSSKVELSVILKLELNWLKYFSSIFVSQMKHKVPFTQELNVIFSPYGHFMQF